MGYKSKYTGQEVENLLDKVNQGGGGSVGGAYALINHGTDDTTLTLTPNTFHVWGEVAALTLTFGEEQSGVANEYLFQFESGSEATTLALPDGIVWSNGDTPVIESKCTYQISILNNLAAIMKFKKKEIAILEFTIAVYEGIGWGTEAVYETYSYEEGMTWDEWVNSDYNANGYYMIDGNGYVYNNNVGMTASGKTVVKSAGLEVEGNDLIDARLNYVID